MSSFEIEGLDQFEKDMLQVIVKKYPDEAKKFLAKQARDVKNQAKSDTPIDDGELVKHWKVSSKAKKKASANFIEAKVTNDAPHSHLVESGHMIYNQYGGDYGFYPGVHMLEKAVMKKDAEFANKFDEFIDRMIDEVKL